MKRLLLAVTAAVLALLPISAFAHPLGNFTVNRYSRIEPAGDAVRVFYVLDMAEIPAFQEMPRMDLDRDGQVSAAENEQFAQLRADEILRGLHLSLNGAPAEMKLASHSLTFPEGQGGLKTLRLEALFEADTKLGGQSVRIEYRDDNEQARIGWREIVVVPGSTGTEITQSSVSSTDPTAALTVYPEEMLSSPLDVRSASITAKLGEAGSDPLAQLNDYAATGALERTRSAITDLVAAPNLTPAVIALSLLAAVFLGALHALEPGHGKTVVAAYLVGSRGTAKQALLLGATVTVTHTAGVYVLGIVTLFLSQYILPERLYPILQVVSGLLVVGVGLWLLGKRVSGLKIGRWQIGQPAMAVAQDHVHETPVEHAHTHAPQGRFQKLVNARRAQEQGAVYAQSGASHSHGGMNHAHSEPAAATHSHGGSVHSHAVPQKLSLESLVAMGISGGLIPCPGALVVLLGAVALQRIGFGLLLIVAFSLGLAAVLVGIGLMLVYARGFLNGFSLGGSWAPRLLPVASAFIITAVGAGLTFSALPAL